MISINDMEHLKHRAAEFTQTTSEGVVVSRLGLSITLFFKEGYTVEKREGILACFQRFREEFGEQLRYQTHDFKGMAKYTPENIVKVEAKIRQQGLYGRSEWYVSDAKGANDAPNFILRFLNSVEAGGKEALSYICLVLPWDYIYDEAGMARFESWLMFLCEQVEPYSGDAGYCLVLPRDYYDYFPLEYQLAQRYPSMLVISTSHTAKNQYFHAIRGANWYTLLSQKLVRRLGGREWIKHAFSKNHEIEVVNFRDGLIIRAGRHPDLTPKSEGLSPAYQMVNQLVRPIRVKYHEGHSLHFYGANHFTEETTYEWYARYDNAPLIRTPLQSGFPALVGGEWKTASQPNSTLRLNQGDIAPTSRDGQVIMWELVLEIPEEEPYF
ncbi:type VI immunity family protein [Thorsellia kenyensis]|uniref:Type VI immunity family protein n=1 Tax=Thorsellia kenyensis TaxID=1549888 RepID=A0ABV6CAW8_9GAMM